jgi:hypothetical protein
MAKKAISKPSPPMVTTIPITKARINLGVLVQRVHLNKVSPIIKKGRQEYHTTLSTEGTDAKGDPGPGCGKQALLGRRE